MKGEKKSHANLRGEVDVFLGVLPIPLKTVVGQFELQETQIDGAKEFCEACRGEKSDDFFLMPVIEEKGKVVNGGREGKKRKKSEERVVKLKGQKQRRRRRVGANVVYS